MAVEWHPETDVDNRNTSVTTGFRKHPEIPGDEPQRLKILIKLAAKDFVGRSSGKPAIVGVC